MWTPMRLLGHRDHAVVRQRLERYVREPRFAPVPVVAVPERTISS